LDKVGFWGGLKDCDGGFTWTANGKHRRRVLLGSLDGLKDGGDKGEELGDLLGLLEGLAVGVSGGDLVGRQAA
jgi:hypothetical protein